MSYTTKLISGKNGTAQATGKDFFSCRFEKVEQAVKDCNSEVISGKLIDNWILTE